jgi:hypothetical protein
MKKPIIITTAVIISLIVLAQSGIIDDLVLFLLVGVVPGTSYSIPPSVMLVIITAIIWLILFRLTAFELLYSNSKNRTAKHHQTHKKRMPRRRFSEI